MKKVFLIFGCFIGKEILSQPDNLMQCRQHSSLSAAGVQDSAAKVVIIIINKRGNRSFGLFWNAVLKEKKKHVVSEKPSLSNKRKQPPGYDHSDNDF